MKLSTRLVLLILGCLLPILAAQTYSQMNLNDARRAQHSRLLLRQAALASSEMGSIIDGVTQLAALVERLPPVSADSRNCGEQLGSVQHDLAAYRFLAIHAPNGALLCGSPTESEGFADSHRQWIAELATMHGARAGALVLGGSSAASFLPVGIAIPDPATATDSRVLVAALDADWLAKRLDATRLDREHAVGRATVTLVDSNGMIVARFPGGEGAIGQLLPEWEKHLVQRQSEGVETITDPAGQAVIAAYVPVPPIASGLAVIETMTARDAAADFDDATHRDLMVIGAATLLALLLAWVAGRRFIYQPTETLLLTARKLHDGDLSARAPLSDAGAEFTALGESFNSMAAGLQAREMERRQQASFLEAQVAERTRELSESNNRLQVAIAGREKTEAALHQAHKLQAVGQLAGGIAHDFNNMLATILGNLELMERRVSQPEREWTPSDAERFSRLIERATGAVQRGSKLTSRLLAFSRRQRLAARPTDVNTLLRELISLATSTLGRSVHVVPQLADGLWPAMVDPSQVEAAILGLCLNARDAMPQGGNLTISTANVTLPGGTADNDLPAGSYIRICVADTGTGMTPEVKARAFDPFFTTKGSLGSSGLGLSQVYGMARQCGGDVIIDSTPADGTRVTLFLPKATLSETAETSPVGTSAHRPVHRAGNGRSYSGGGRRRRRASGHRRNGAGSGMRGGAGRGRRARAGADPEAAAGAQAYAARLCHAGDERLAVGQGLARPRGHCADRPGDGLCRTVRGGRGGGEPGGASAQAVHHRRVA